MFHVKKIVARYLLAVLCTFVFMTAPQAASVTTLISGLNNASGGDYSALLDQYFFVERNTGQIWRFDLNTRIAVSIGSGYDEPTDIVVSDDGVHAYLTDNSGTGNLLKIELANPNRADATVVATGVATGGLTGQIAIDEPHGLAYVIENTRDGALWRVNLASGAITSLTEFPSEPNPWGLILNDDATIAYVSQLGGAAGKIIRIDLASGGSETVATGFFNPLYLAWSGPAQDAIYVAESAVGKVSRVDLTSSPASVQEVVSGLPNINTRSVEPISEEKLLVSVAESLVGVNLTPFDATGPTILGIGHVPFDRILGGYADTTGDPGYFFQVKDAPFGGTLSLMINHPGAYGAPNNARWYRVLVDGVQQVGTFTDFIWDSTKFVSATAIPHTFGPQVYYRVRAPDQLWFKPWLGYRLNTKPLGNGPHTITVELYDGAGTPGTLVDTDNLLVEVDNQRPVAIIDQIFRGGSPVNACGIVTGVCSDDKFTFRITASDPQSHMRSWRLTALWGENKSDLIDSDAYGNHLPGPLWSGLPNGIVPAPAWDAFKPGDPSSANCAHTFELRAWDRAINGYNHIHHTRYHQSVTISLDCP